MHSIDIAQVIGTPNAIIHKFGLQVYEHAKLVIDKGQKIQLDFSNLKNVTTGFFHASIGNLYKTYGAKFYELVEFKGVDQGDWKEKLEDAISIASNPKMATEIDKAISELFVS